MRVTRYSLIATLLFIPLLLPCTITGDAAHAGITGIVVRIVHTAAIVIMSIGFIGGVLLHEFFIRTTRILFENSGCGRIRLYVFAYMMHAAMAIPTLIILAYVR
ncbi:MAG: hypothetical protein HZC28_04060 [Spirochaetes bacterium]|nr:hypothetical protein [Spirochaetota bacterium]